MLIRRANSEDAKKAFPLYQALIGRDELKLFYSEEDFQYLIQRPNCYFFVAIEEHEEVVGLLQAFDNVIWCYIDVFFVQPQYQKKGIGANLLKALLAVKEPSWRALELCYDPEDVDFEKWLVSHDYQPLTTNATPLRWMYQLCNQSAKLPISK